MTERDENDRKFTFVIRYPVINNYRCVSVAVIRCEFNK